MPPFVGWGGLYLGFLSNELGKKLYNFPNVDLFTRMGFAVRVGLGVHLELGPISAGASISVIGQIEGAFGWKNNNSRNVDRRLGDIYYDVVGIVGAMAEIYGSVNFVVITAGVHAYIAVSFGLEPTNVPKPIRIYIDGEIVATAELHIHIDLWIGSITARQTFAGGWG